MMAAAPEHLRHIVVLMMSGRSFDHMLGSLKQQDPRIDGLTGSESNPDTSGAVVPVQPLAEYQGQLSPDPGQRFPDVELQMLGDTPSNQGVANMQGFVRSYFQQHQSIEHSHQIMYYFPSSKLPVLTTLARKYAVFNRWFSSVPGPTIPNLGFAHYGTAFGKTDMSPLLGNGAASIFERMQQAGRTAKFYSYDVQSSVFVPVELLKNQPALFATYSQFLADCRNGTLPDYTYIEPNHTDHQADNGFELASDQHPDHNVLYGEQFIASVYNAIRQNPVVWESTTLLIVYDQHGGTYDHVAPPTCVSDGLMDSTTGFGFDRLGVRVPAVLVSPWIPEGTVVSGRIFEHASIPATVAGQFMGGSVQASPREMNANTFADLLSLPAPRKDYIRFALDADPGTSSDTSSVGQVLKVQTGTATSDLPLSPVLQEQVRQLQQEEKVLPREAQTGTDISTIKTEAQANAYIQAVTAKLHPQARPSLPFKPAIAGYRSDTAALDDKDLLNIMPEVEALCSVLAAKNVKPPISVGLFGDWGTGKTFFMQKMQLQFDAIQQKAKEAKNTAYCRYIAQLWFNAWHYIDANLWASLVSHIFEELASYLSPNKDDPQSRGMLLRQLNTAQELLAEAKREKEQAEKQRTVAEAELKTLAESRAQTEVELANLRLPDLKKLLESDSQLKTELEGMLKSTGFAGVMDSVNELEDVLRDAYSLGGRLRSALLSVWQSKHRKEQFGLLLLVLLGFPALAFALRFWRPELLSTMGTVWGEVTVLITALTAFLKKYMRVGSDYASQLEQKIQKVKELVAKKTEEKSAKQLELEKKLNETRAKEAGASKQFSDAQERVRQVEEKIKDIDEGRSLSKFILERVQSDDYRKYLGIISSVRKDFEKLDTLLLAGSAAVPNSSFMPIERIILYIDDLDRCPADKVFEVLQAIHLLLAFKLFVVVVGVDSRWLLRSLRVQSQVLGEKNLEHTETENAHWEATPLNYLEKIFQIPFALRPMPPKGFQNLMDNLTDQQKVAVEPTPTGGAGQSPSPAPGASSQAGEATASTEASKSAAALSSVSVSVFDPNPEPLQLKDCERKFMWKLHRLFPSPRAAKRFVNIYRLLRAAMSAEELDNFVRDDESGEYKALQLLLGIQTGYPEQAAEIINKLLETRPKGAWEEFLQTCGPSTGKTTVTAGLPRAQDNRSAEQAKAESWEEFKKRVKEVASEVFEKMSCTDFLKWAPRVARYSFQTVRALQDEPEAEAPAGYSASTSR
jgi:phospholipase C